MAIIKHRLEGIQQFIIPGPGRPSFAVNYKDLFNMQYIYHVLHEWMIENGWATREDDDFGEKDYIQRENPSFGKEIWVRWRFEKDTPLGEPYLKYTLDLDMHAIGLKEVEAVVNNKKIKADKCELDIQGTLALKIDYAKYTRGTFLQSYRDLFIDKIMRKTIDYHKREVTREKERLQEAIKEYLKMHKYKETLEFEGLWNPTVREYPKK